VSTNDLDKETRLLEQLAVIRQSFLRRMQGELPLFREQLARARAGDSTELEQLHGFVHRIHGGAATFNFAAVSESAEQVENLLETLIGTSVPSIAQPEDLRRLAECGQRLVLEIGAATTRE
jgi:HPt (histidine-containing phosphotransfer) domain-containing protein